MSTFSTIWSSLSRARASFQTTISVRCATAFFSMAFRCLGALLECSEMVSAALFDVCSRLLAVRPCGVYRPQEGAIVVVGGEAELGRRIALSLSELGYTVFALCRTQTEEVSEDVPGKASNVSSLLYEWHHKRKLSQDPSSWGLIAPIVVDIASDTQRAHAFETVDAHCAAHSLHLIAAVISSSNTLAQPFGPRIPSFPHITTDASPPEPSEEAIKGMSLWGDVAQRSITEPFLVAQSCSNLLSASSGKIILVSGHYSSLSQLQGTVVFNARRPSAALGSLRIRLSSVLIDPLIPSTRQPHGCTSNDASTLQRMANPPDAVKPITRNAFRCIFEDVLQQFHSRDDDVARTVHQIVESCYPKYYYIIGIRSFLNVTMTLAPDVLRLLVEYCGY